MGINNFLKTAEKNYAIGIYGILLTIISLASGYYLAIKDKEPKIIFDVLSNTEVISINENVSKLKVVYNNEDLRIKQKKLVLLTIRISNLGDAHIKESDYYSKSEFGFKLNNATIAERPTLLDASNEFLSQNIKIKNDSLNNVIFNKIPLDKSQSFTIKVLTIVNGNNIPKISPIGHISGANGKLVLIESYKSSLKEEIPITNLDKLFRILGILFIVIIVLIILKTWYDSKFGRDPTNISKGQREHVAEKIKDNHKESEINYQIDVFDTLIDIYVEFGHSYLREIRYNYIENSVFIEKFMSETSNGNNLDKLFDLEEDKKVRLKKLFILIFSNGLVNKGNNGIAIDLKFIKRLDGLNWTISEFEFNVS